MSKPLDDLLDEQLTAKINQESTSAASRFESLKQAVKNKFGFVMGNEYSKAKFQGVKWYSSDVDEDRSFSISGKGRIAVELQTYNYNIYDQSTSNPQTSNITITIDDQSTTIPLLYASVAGSTGFVLEIYFSKNFSITVGKRIGCTCNYQLL